MMVLLVLLLMFYSLIFRLVFKDLSGKLESAVEQYLDRKKDSNSLLIEYFRRKFQIVDLKTKDKWQNLFIRIVKARKDNRYGDEVGNNGKSVDNYSLFRKKIEEDRFMS